MQAEHTLCPQSSKTLLSALMPVNKRTGSSHAIATFHSRVCPSAVFALVRQTAVQSIQSSNCQSLSPRAVSESGDYEDVMKCTTTSCAKKVAPSASSLLFHIKNGRPTIDPKPSTVPPLAIQPSRSALLQLRASQIARDISKSCELFQCSSERHLSTSESREL